MVTAGAQKTMSEEQVSQWTDETIQRGGMRGRMDGFELGFMEGFKEGFEQARKEIAKNMMRYSSFENTEQTTIENSTITTLEEKE